MASRRRRALADTRHIHVIPAQLTDSDQTRSFHIERTPMRRCAALLLCSALLLYSLPVAAKKATQYPAFYAFGDSLVDNGNVLIGSVQLKLPVPLPPSISPNRTYFDGRFSNGPVAFEYLWQMLEQNNPASTPLRPYLESPCENGQPIRPAVNFAFGGSGTAQSTLTSAGIAVPGLLGQVGLFACALQGQEPVPEALYALWSGANDYLGQLSSAPLEPRLTPAQVVTNIAVGILWLYDLGARRIVVLNYADPSRVSLPVGDAERIAFSRLIRKHNVLLAGALALLSRLPGIDLIRVDISDMFNRLPPGANTTVPALDALFPPEPGQLPMSLCLNVDPFACRDVRTFAVDRRFVFWDVQHPTTQFHRLIAERTHKRLADQD
jgi:phospholipase/lecithinase/hemolysin